jgi:Fumarase C C-terminus
VTGYNNAAQIANAANADDSTLKEAALKSGEADAKTFDDVVDPRKLVGEDHEGPRPHPARRARFSNRARRCAFGHARRCDHQF